MRKEHKKQELDGKIGIKLRSLQVTAEIWSRGTLSVVPLSPPLTRHTWPTTYTSSKTDNKTAASHHARYYA